MGSIGPKFTWTRGQFSETFKGARLDCGLCNFCWKNRFRSATVSQLLRIHLDHAPLVTLSKDTPNRPPNSFQIQAAWLLHCDFPDVIQRFWNPCSPLNTNIYQITQMLTEWNACVFGNIFHAGMKISDISVDISPIYPSIYLRYIQYR